MNTCWTVLMYVFLFSLPGLLQLSPFLGHVHFCQDEACLVSPDRLLCSKYFPCDFPLVCCLAAVSGLWSLFCFNHRRPILRHLGDWDVFWVDMLSGEIVFPGEAFDGFILFAIYFVLFRLSFAWVEEGIVQKELLFVVGTYIPVFGADHTFSF